MQENWLFLSEVSQYRASPNFLKDKCIKLYGQYCSFSSIEVAVCLSQFHCHVNDMLSVQSYLTSSLQPLLSLFEHKTQLALEQSTNLHAQ